MTGGKKMESLKQMTQWEQSNLKTKKKYFNYWVTTIAAWCDKKFFSTENM